MNLKGIHLAGSELSYPNYCLGVKRLYFFDANTVDIASCLKLSARGKLELNNFNRTEKAPWGSGWLSNAQFEIH
jgi:hypothetical protein